MISAVVNIKKKDDSSQETDGPQLEIEWVEVLEAYNVLWIGWSNGIAYRKGLGKVDADMWRQQPRDIVDIVLGEVSDSTYLLIVSSYQPLLNIYPDQLWASWRRSVNYMSLCRGT